MPFFPPLFTVYRLMKIIIFLNKEVHAADDGCLMFVLTYNSSKMQMKCNKKWTLPELEEVLEVVPDDWDCSNAGLVDTLLLVLVPSSAVFLKKLCCRA